jgi:endonuclease III
MPVSNATIGRVLAKVREHNRQYKVPAVTLVARNHHTPYHVLISTLISLRTKDDVTWKAAERLFAAAYTPEAIARLPEQKIAQLIYPAGFYKTKAKTIKDVTKTILGKYAGRVPDDVDELTTMRGVGRKTANLVVTLGFGKPGICVDVHVFRISNRWGYVKTRTPDETEQVLRSKLPPQYWIEYNDLLVTFGQNHCVPISPRCSTCPLRNVCPRVGVVKNR